MPKPGNSEKGQRVEPAAQNKSQEAKNFVKTHWEKLAIFGTIAGAAVWLIAKYYQKSRNIHNQQLELVAEGAETAHDPTSTLLHGATDLQQYISKPELEAVVRELTPHITDRELRDAVTTILKIK